MNHEMSGVKRSSESDQRIDKKISDIFRERGAMRWEIAAYDKTLTREQKADLLNLDLAQIEAQVAEEAKQEKVEKERPALLSKQDPALEQAVMQWNTRWVGGAGNNLAQYDIEAGDRLLEKMDAIAERFPIDGSKAPVVAKDLGEIRALLKSAHGALSRTDGLKLKEHYSSGKIKAGFQLSAEQRSVLGEAKQELTKVQEQLQEILSRGNLKKERLANLTSLYTNVAFGKFNAEIRQLLE